MNNGETHRPIQLVISVLLYVAALAPGMTATGSLLSLGFPVECKLHTECSIQNYFDHESGKGFADYQCGKLGYDGHDGTDIRLPNLKVMSRGVTVVAAAAGVVRATRDSMPDISVREKGRTAVRGVEAGNAVVLRHGDAWETQYSHLLRGSVTVRPGDKVERGDPLGQIGLSGNTEFPHVHFEVRYRGRPVDPFVGLDPNAPCGPGSNALWSSEALDTLAYRPTGLLQAGFSTTAPDTKALASGLPEMHLLPSRVPAIVFWSEIYGARAGDEEHIRIVDPGGRTVAEKRSIIDRDKARWASYAGRKMPAGGWPKGVYSARYRLTRHAATESAPVLSFQQVIEVE